MAKYDIQEVPSLFINGKLLVKNGYSGTYSLNGFLKKGPPPSSGDVRITPNIDFSFAGISNAVEKQLAKQ